MKKVKSYLTRLKTYWYYSTKMAVLFYRSNPKICLGMLIGVIIVALTPLLWSYLLRLIIDFIIEVSQKKIIFDPNYFGRLLFFFFIIELLGRITWRLIDYFDRIIYLDFGRFLTIKTNEKFASLDFEYWEDPELNNLFNKVRESYTWRPINFAHRQLWLVQGLVSVISNTLVVIGLGPIYFLLIFFSSLPEFLVGVKFSRNVWSIHGAKGPIRRDFWNTSSYLGSHEYLPEIHILGIQKALLQRLDRLYNKFFNYQKIEIKKMSKNRILTAIFSFAVYLLITSLILFKALAGLMTIGTLSFYISRVSALSGSFKDLFHNLSQNFEDLLYVEDLFKVFNLKRKIGKNPKGVKVKAPFTIEFKNVWFKYPNSKKYVLKDFNLTLEPNKKIALIGENGAGKTTLVRLLVRFYDVTRGKIFINGHDLAKINLDHWRANLGALFQDFNRYAYSVQENIRLGNVNQPFEKELFDKVLTKSGAKSFVDKLPKKDKTILSKQFKDGSELSTGEWQKIALSRAFFRNAPLLILDEPTSAIDAKSEYDIFQQIHKFEKGKGVIMISHRFSTVRGADQIYVIDKGKITEKGTHRQLLDKKGHYAELFSLQAKGYEG
ncbi:ABC transporter ATP-binding protein [Candidatus Shapirobacteria bacterium]|nr:ABC transporter ATP-binding protein [Candidatus Shapirobacteria bacterium]